MTTELTWTRLEELEKLCHGEGAAKEENIKRYHSALRRFLPKHGVTRLPSRDTISDTLDNVEHAINRTKCLAETVEAYQERVLNRIETIKTVMRDTTALIRDVSHQLEVLYFANNAANVRFSWPKFVVGDVSKMYEDVEVSLSDEVAFAERVNDIAKCTAPLERLDAYMELVCNLAQSVKELEGRLAKTKKRIAPDAKCTEAEASTAREFAKRIEQNIAAQKRKIALVQKVHARSCVALHNLAQSHLVKFYEVAAAKGLSLDKTVISGIVKLSNTKGE